MTNQNIPWLMDVDGPSHLFCSSVQTHANFLFSWQSRCSRAGTYWIIVAIGLTMLVTAADVHTTAHHYQCSSLPLLTRLAETCSGTWSHEFELL